MTRLIVARLALSALALSLVLSGCTSAPPPVAVVDAALQPTMPPQTAPATPTRQVPATSIPTVEPTTPPTATPTQLPLSPTPATPTFTVRSTPRVGIQIGHLRSNELPDELERLRNSTGAYFAGISESTLNGDIAVRVKALLEARGVEVELIPATVPPSYDVDAFVAIHADGIANGVKRGWKLATPWRTSPASQQLLRSVAESYPNATGMPEDVGGVTVNMRGYYAFAWRRHQHAVARTTPALIVEMGFLTSAADREIMIGQPDRVARGIADGILNYLDSGVWRNAEARVSPDFKLMQPKESGIVVRTRPSDLAGAVLTIGPDARFLPFLLENGWYEGVVRGEWRAVGWIRADQLTPTDDQMVIPTPTGGG